MKIALMYDFDKTLCTKDMQEYTFIPRIHMEAKTFWEKANVLAEDKKMDKILAYMYTMLVESNKNEQAVRRENFEECGKNIEYFPGVLDWFTRISEFGRGEGATIEHYIISSGLKEIIEGSSIGKFFKEIYACEFFYDHNGIAVWPQMVVNFTGKTQYLYRINKGVLDVSNDAALNEYTPEHKRPIPFQNMIYFGDGMTDVPIMKLVHVNGGRSIGVYPKDNEKAEAMVKTLCHDGRLDFYTVANYEEDSDLDKLVKRCIHSMVVNHELRILGEEQKAST